MRFQNTKQTGTQFFLITISLSVQILGSYNITFFSNFIYLASTCYFFDKNYITYWSFSLTSKFISFASRDVMHQNCCFFLLIDTPYLEKKEYTYQNVITLRSPIWFEHAKKRHLNNYRWHLNNYTGSTPKITVWTVIFATDTVKITVHTVKCTGAHRHFSSVTSNYSNAVFYAKPENYFWKNFKFYNFFV